MNKQVKTVMIIMVVLLLVFSGLVLGRVVSIGDTRLGIVYFAGIFGMLLLGMPIVTMWLCVVSTLVVCGVVVYNSNGLEVVWWGSYILGATLFVPAFFQMTKKKQQQLQGSGLAMPILFFCTIFFMSAIINQIELMQLIVAAKVWLLLSGIFAFLSVVPLKDAQFQMLIKVVFGIALIQIIPVIYQFVFVRAQLMKMGYSTTSSDSVVGTFGGSPTSGGMTGALAAFLVFNLMMLLSAKRYCLVGQRFWLYLPLLVLPMLMIEVKALFIYIPVATFFLYKDYFVSQPMKFIKIGLIGFFVMLVMLFAYQTYHWSDKRGDMMTNMERMFAYSFAENTGNKEEEGVMTRVEVITFWWDHQTIADPIPLLLGHGPSASKTGGIEIGSIAKKFQPREIDRTGLALILWDFGVIGFMGVCWFFYAAYKFATRLRKRFSQDVWKTSFLHGIQAIIPLFFLALLYRNDIPYAAPMMLSLMLTLGMLMQLHRSPSLQLNIRGKG